MFSLEGKTILITGGSRGIGEAIALRFAQSGGNIVIIAKEDPEANSEKALVLKIDVRDAIAIKQAVAETVSQFGGIDILINNISAFCFTNTLQTSAEQFDLLNATNGRATFLISQACIPFLRCAQNPHIINISPPLHMDAKWFKQHLAFTMSKYAMSMCTLGMAAEFQESGIAVNSLWPLTTIATSTIKTHFASEVYAGCRKLSIMADAAFTLIQGNSRECTGNFFIDEEILRESGMVDFSKYAIDPGAKLVQDLFIANNSSHMLSLSPELFLQAEKSC